MSKPAAYSYIRFSTPDQRKGDSLRRQLEASEQYARDHGLVLDTKLKLRDEGLSAFHGVHKAKGALGQFLERVKSGQISEGSVLLVESLDRLSREEILEALEQFLALIRSGIKIVTLADNGREYTRESINANWSDLIISLTIMSRAHEESKMKAFRLGKAWEGKREKAANGERKLTAKCPSWLKLSSDKKSYELIPKRGAVIEQIFRMKLAGKSSKKIAQEFNQTDNFPWMPASNRHHKQTGWWPSYIEKIFQFRAVLGEFQPHRLQDGKRVPVGEPIKGYFPLAFPDAEDLFYRVQSLIKSNQTAKKDGTGFVGRAGSVQSEQNLFINIIKCGYCGTSMHYTDKGPWKYYVCSSAVRRAGCDYLSVPVLEIENVVLRYCRGLDPAEILPGREETESKIRLLRGQIATIEGKLQDATEREKNFTDGYGEAKDKGVRKILEVKLKSVLDEKKALEQSQTTIQREFEIASRAGVDVKEHLQSLRELFDAMSSLQGKELVDLKLRLREELRRLIERILIYPEGDPRIVGKLAGAYKEMGVPVPNPKDELKILIEFKSGIIRVIYPRRDTEYDNRTMLEYDEEMQQILAEHYGVEFPKTAKNN